MKARKQSWHKRKEFPEKWHQLDVSVIIEHEKVDIVKSGRIPSSMDNKWFIYFENNYLYIHRSWTGVCIYKVPLIEDGKGLVINRVMVNGDFEQYKFSNLKDEEELFIEIFNFYIEEKI